MARQPKPASGTKVLSDAAAAPTQAKSQGPNARLRKTVIAIGVFVFLIVAGLLAGGGGKQDADSNPPAAVGGDAKPVVQEPTGGNARISARRTVDGVPVGYPRSRAGAVKAAVNYQLARTSSRYLSDPVVRAKTLRAMAAEETGGELQKRDDKSATQILKGLALTPQKAQQSLLSRSSVLGTRTVSYVPEAATVELWMAGLVGVMSEESPLPPTASWTTVQINLQWQNGDWKVSAIDSANGPTPVESGADAPTDTAEFQRTDQDFDAPPYVD